MSYRIAAVIGTGAIAALVLAGCSASPVLGEVDVGASASPPAAAETEAPVAPVTHEDTCAWEAARLSSGSAADVPTSAGTDLASALVGSWQHTHIDSGSGYVALDDTKDIRYVFPSATQMLYCQDVQGATAQAEHSAAVELDGLEIVLPAPATGYAVNAWTDDTMVWTNNRDGSLYLLKRR